VPDFPRNVSAIHAKDWLEGDTAEEGVRTDSDSRWLRRWPRAYLLQGHACCRASMAS